SLCPGARGSVNTPPAIRRANLPDIPSLRHRLRESFHKGAESPRKSAAAAATGRSGSSTMGARLRVGYLLSVSHDTPSSLPPFARRVREIEPFRVMKVLARAKQLEAQGRDIVHLEIGEPDFSTAAPIVAAGQAALARGLTHYTPAAGLPELRAAISDWYAQTYGAAVPAERILITPGASGALLLAVALLVDVDRTLLMADPGYPYNRHFLRLIEGRGQMLPVSAEQRCQLNAALADQHWQPQTAGVLVASPANPTGEVLDRETLSALWDVCQRRGGHLLVDEIYHGLVYEGSAPSIVEITDGAFAINSFSKYFGMTGWRLGWMVAPESAVPELEKLAQNLFIAPSTPAQYAALAAFTPEAQAIFQSRRDELHRRRDYLL